MQVKDTDLHLYLERGPDTDTFSDLLSLYGFLYDKSVQGTSLEPPADYFTWNLPGVSDAGFRLLFFHSLFSDDLNKGKFESFIILSGYSDSSDIDFNMIDITSLLLIQRYGGRIHNPQRIDKISTSFLLSGRPFSGFLKV
jgi:hypothetical protein